MNIITPRNVEQYGPFLKLWGIIDQHTADHIDNTLLELSSNQAQRQVIVPPINSIQFGMTCCVQMLNSHYYRAQVINVTMLVRNAVEVFLIDYGRRAIVAPTSLRIVDHLVPNFFNIPPQAQEFILANVTHVGASWNMETLKLINDDLLYKDFTFNMTSRIGGCVVIKLIRNNEDGLLPLFNRGLLLSIATNAQIRTLQNTPTVMKMNVMHPPASSSSIDLSSPLSEGNSTTTILSYKTMSLEPNTDYDVYVSYVTDGPSQFYVQLQNFELVLSKLMRELNSMTLHQLEEDIIPGTICVAKCIEDDHICRAVVTSIVDGEYKVFYVDFGNIETVSIDNLFQIPSQFVIPKVMATPFCLADLKRSDISVEMKCTFKDFVCDKLLKLRTIPSQTRGPIQLCALWNNDNVNVLDVLKKPTPLVYGPVPTLSRGITQEVHVSYVHSCSCFYVQVKSKDEQLRFLMAELQLKCPTANLLTEITLDAPCCALFEGDGQWYRAQIVSVAPDAIKVKYVDYGNEESVAFDNLRAATDEQVSALRPQAMECCLNGYQNMPEDPERDGIFEELILEKDYSMKVVDIKSNKTLVDLIDSTRYNVGSLLLERIASAKCQASPMLIQDSHNIEMRKRSSPSADKNYNNYQTREPREPTSKQQSWRQSNAPISDSWENDMGSNGFDKGDNNNSSRNFEDSRRGVNSFSRDKTKRNDTRKDDWKTGNDFSRNEYRREDRGKPEQFNRNFETRGDDFDNQRTHKSSSSSLGKRNWSESNEVKVRGDSPDKNWRRNSRDSSTSEGRRPIKIDSPKRQDSTGRRPNRREDSTEKPFSVPKSSSPPKASAKIPTIQNPVPFTTTYQVPQVEGLSKKVIVSWFHDPQHFFCQLEEYQSEFQTMMTEIQDIYTSIKPVKAPVGAPVIALFPEDKIMYRARVLSMQGFQYKVQFVDFGNVSSTEKVWPLDQKFMTLPAQAICCSLNGVLPIQAQWPEQDKFSEYFGRDSYMCNFLSNMNDTVCLLVSWVALRLILGCMQSVWTLLLYVKAGEE